MKLKFIEEAEYYIGENEIIINRDRKRKYAENKKLRQQDRNEARRNKREEQRFFSTYDEEE